jgi:hypothetical protein
LVQEKQKFYKAINKKSLKVHQFFWRVGKKSLKTVFIGATTPSIMTLSILTITIKDLITTVSINDVQHDDTHHLVQ